MIDVYLSRKPAKEFLDSVLKRYEPNYQIARTPQGKPYLVHSKWHFNLSHSNGYIVVAVSQLPIGIDLEVCKQKSYQHILNKLSPLEQNEIVDELTFLQHWTVKESYVKWLGDSIVRQFHHLDYHNHILYHQGKQVECNFISVPFCEGAITICSLEKEFSLQVDL